MRPATVELNRKTSNIYQSTHEGTNIFARKELFGICTKYILGSPKFAQNFGHFRPLGRPKS